MTRSFLVTACVLLLSACAAQPGGNLHGANTPADVGELPENYAELATRAVKADLEDPFGVKVEVGEIVQSECRIGVYGKYYGWRVAVKHNGGRSMGDRPFNKVRYVWFSNGMSQRISRDNPDNCIERSDGRNLVEY